ncbi:VanW family protein [Nocardia sp. CC201C]|uniref:VanW family protein n=1 Tax=Nocardia sp. CC201C TaxID=3044575 RepID=UPI0024A9689D|nr:VanW family protein [Nocardia sp. CC201C]
MTSGSSTGRHTPTRNTGPEPAPGTRFLDSATARRAGIAAGVLMALSGIAYAADWAMSSGEVPRGVQVAGIDIGGMDRAAAQSVLELELNSRATQPLTVRVGDESATFVPANAGLGVDWTATWDRIGGQPLNPFVRLASLFTDRAVSPVADVDDAALDRQVQELRAFDLQPVEGTVRFEDARPVPVYPVPGRVLDAPAARTTLLEHWADGGVLDLPVISTRAEVTRQGVDTAVSTLAEPAVQSPVTFTGKGGNGTLEPAQLATVLRFTPDGHGGLALAYDNDAAIAALAPQLAPTEVEPKDATFEPGGNRLTLVPAVVGDKISWPKTLEALPQLVSATGERTAAVVYEPVQPKLTTEAAEKLGLVEVVGSFTTGGFSGPSGVNIRTVAAKVNGAIVLPGDTFSLNGFTGTRGAAEGYVESGIIDKGRPSTAVGGGISQFATTLYNAAYFAGMEDAGHTEHSYYISRYPAAREATVFDGAIDLQFRNNTPYGVYIEASADSSTVTVRLWSTKTVDVESIPGPRTKETEPTTITLPKGDDCIATEGAPGFTTSDTRVIRDYRTGKEISRHTRTVKYDPIPVVKCVAPGEDSGEDADEDSGR